MEAVIEYMKQEAVLWESRIEFSNLNILNSNSDNRGFTELLFTCNV